MADGSMADNMAEPSLDSAAGGGISTQQRLQDTPLDYRVYDFNYSLAANATRFECAGIKADLSMHDLLSKGYGLFLAARLVNAEYNFERPVAFHSVHQRLAVIHDRIGKV